MLTFISVKVKKNQNFTQSGKYRRGLNLKDLRLRMSKFG